MSRLPAIDPATAVGRTGELLDAVRAQLGIAPNFLRVLGHSPAALESFLGLYGATARFSVEKATQERIALVVAESNRCSYCLSAHTAIGRGAGLTNEEMLAKLVSGAQRYDLTADNATSWIDPAPVSGTARYWVTAVGPGLNESQPSNGLDWVTL